MKRNQVQFQKGLSLNEFLKHYGTEQQCFDALFKWRWPNGFECPNCGHGDSCHLNARKLRQCYQCHRQTSVTAGTVFESSKLPLTVWFQAMYLITQTKKGVSVMQLHRQLGISYNAAWRLKHKLMRVIVERDRNRPLSDLVANWTTRICVAREAAARTGAAGKTPFVAAVQTTGEGQPGRVKLTVVKGFRKSVIASWAGRHLVEGSRVVSDGLACFGAVAEAGCRHDSVVCGGGRAAVENPQFYWVNTVLGNLKSSLRSTYHSFQPKYAQRYLSEFEYRFNRRCSLPDLIPRLAWVALRTPPIPEKLLKLGLT